MFLSPSMQFFKLDVLYEAPNGELSMAPASHIMQQLEAILCTAADPAPYPVGILTTEHRDIWAQARERLANGEGGTVRGSGLYELLFQVSSPPDPVNTSSLHDIQTAMFTVCLDKPHPQIPGPSTPFRNPYAIVLVSNCLHGNGTQQNSCNRWFDSSMQVR